MKRILIAITLALAASAAYAACTTHTIFGPNGQATICTTCCAGSNCTTTCS